MTIAILTEKPDQARSWKDALNASPTATRGVYEGVYEGQSYKIVASIGHIFEFVKPGLPGSTINPDDETTFRSWDVLNLPWDETKLSWKRTHSERVASKVRELKEELKNVNEIAIATDLDPTGEGDLIAIEIIQELGYATGKKYSRVHFLDDKPKSLQKAFMERKPIADLLSYPEYRKAFYRTRFDYLTMQWTRMAADCTNGITVRQGRLKTAMVKLIGDQLAAHNNYVRKPFYKSSFVDDHGVRYMDKDAPSFDNADEVQIQNFSESKVVFDSSEKKTTPPPALLTLSKLAARLAPKGYKSDQISSVYQEMYEAKILSYPRTEDRHITTEQFNEMAHLVDQIAGVVGADVSKLTHRAPRKTHVKDKGAHGANRPGTNVPASLDEIENKYGACGRAIYEMLAKNFLAMYAEDYVYMQEKGHVEKYPSYVGSVNVPKSLGFKEIFDDADDDSDDDDAASQGLGSLAKPEVFEGAPTRPVHPNQTWLFARLDKDSIGTGATQLSTLIEICKPEKRRRDDKKADPAFVLVKDTKGKLTLGELGEYSYMLTPDTNIGDLSLTKRVQDNMKLIAEGTLDPDEVLKGVADLVKEDLPVMRRNAEEMQKKVTLPPRRTKSELVKGTWNGKEIGIYRDVFDHKLTDDELKRAFAGETIEFTAKGPKDDAPSVKRMLIQEFTLDGKKKIGLRFATKPKSAGGVPLEFCGHVFTDDEVARLEKGEEVSFGDVFVWTKDKGTGKKSSATLVFDKKMKKLGFAKSDGVPNSWGGYTFTPDEKKRLDAGEEVQFGEVFVWAKDKKTGKKSSATLVYDKKGKKLGFVNKKNK